MTIIPLREKFKIDQLVKRIEAGEFDTIDIDALLIKLRPYCGQKRIFREISDFVAHADARDRGLSCEAMIGFTDSIRYFLEYVSPGIPLNIAEPIQPYLYRLFLSQTLLANDQELRSKFKLSRATLRNKIENKFQHDKKSRTYSIRPGKAGRDFMEALQYVTNFIHSKPAFDISDFHLELISVLRETGATFDESSLRKQFDRITLAILCLLNKAEISLPDGNAAHCELTAENPYRLIEGMRSLPTGGLTEEPKTFGNLQISGHIKLTHGGQMLRMSFPVITTRLTPDMHCDSKLFETLEEATEQGKLIVEFLKFPEVVTLRNGYILAGV